MCIYVCIHIYMRHYTSTRRGLPPTTTWRVGDIRVNYNLVWPVSETIMEGQEDQLQHLILSITANSRTLCKNAIIIIAIIIILAIFVVFAVLFCAKILQQIMIHHRLPIFTYKYHHVAKEITNIPYCAVCLQEVLQGERLRKLPQCDHCFHVHCIDEWFQSHSTCPLCRNEVSFVHYYHKHRKYVYEDGFFSHVFSYFIQFFFGKVWEYNENILRWF